MERICPLCSKQYVTYPNRIRKGWRKFCSKLCSSLAKGNKVKRICLVCEKEFIVKKIAIKNSGAKYCSHRCMWKGQTGRKVPSIQGSKHRNWRGGIQFAPYPFSFTNELKEKIRRRDDYVCQLCGITNEEHILIYSYDLVIHHVDYIKENCAESNLITLCNQCNGRVNYNRTYWTDFFQSVLKKEEIIK